MKIYLASSWRNSKQPAVLAALRAAGFEVYDFRNPGPENYGFSWEEIDQEWRGWDTAAFRAALEHPASERGFSLDMAALKACDVCVLLHKCGTSSHLELGFAKGAGKKTVVIWEDGVEPELMIKMADAIVANVEECIAYLSRNEGKDCKACAHCQPDTEDPYCVHPRGGVYVSSLLGPESPTRKEGFCGPLRLYFEQDPDRDSEGRVLP